MLYDSQRHLGAAGIRLEVQPGRLVTEFFQAGLQ